MKDHFGWKIKRDTRGQSELNVIAGWNCKPSWIDPIIIKQNHVKQKIIEGEMKCEVHSKNRMNYKAGG
jgi:hypothetical protein